MPKRRCIYVMLWCSLSFFIHSTCMANEAAESFVPAGIHYEMNYSHTKYIEIYVDDFYMDVFPVSIAEYSLCIKNGACSDAPIYRFIQRNKSGYSTGYHEALNTALLDQDKMTLFTYAEAQGYCASQGKRLPTKSEWTKAARGANNKHRYAWGDTPPDCTNANAKNCPGANDKAKNTDFAPGPYHTYGMLSNFSELTMSIAHPDFDRTQSSRNPLCTKEMYEKYPYQKEYSPMWRTAAGKIFTHPSGQLHVSLEGGHKAYEKEGYREYLSFRCVRSQLLKAEDFNK